MNGANATTSDIANFASGGTIETLATGTGIEVHVTGAATGAADVLNLVMSNSTAGVEAFGSFKALNVETINIDMNDTGTVANTAATIDTVTIAATAAKSIFVTGENGVTLTNTSNAAITTFDASGVTSDGSTTAAGAANDTAANLAVTFLGANTTATAAVSIKGGDGNDVLTGSASIDTVVGNAGDDTLAGAAGADDIFVYNTTDGGAVDSTTAAHSKVSDFNTMGAQATAVDLSTAAKVAASTVLGDTDVLQLNFTNTGSSDQAIAIEGNATATAAQAANATYTVTAGILALAGNGASAVDTLAEWLTEAAAVAATDGEVLAFEFGGDTYLFGQNDTEDLLIELDGVTGVDGLLELTTTFSTALTNVVTFIDIA